MIYCDHCADPLTANQVYPVEVLPCDIDTANKGESATLCPGCYEATKLFQLNELASELGYVLVSPESLKDARDWLAHAEQDINDSYAESDVESAYHDEMILEAYSDMVRTLLGSVEKLHNI